MVFSLWPICVSLKFLFLDDFLHFLSFDFHLLADNTKKSCFKFSPDLVPILRDTKNFHGQ